MISVHGNQNPCHINPPSGAAGVSILMLGNLAAKIVHAPSGDREISRVHYFSDQAAVRRESESMGQRVGLSSAIKFGDVACDHGETVGKRRKLGLM